MIQSLGKEWASAIGELQRLCYPEAMWEHDGTFKQLLSYGLSWGMVNHQGRTLQGWILFQPEPSKHEVSDGRTIAYCYDLAVIPSTRLQGIATDLWQHACKQLRWQDYWIRAHCRKQSYSILSKPQRGYQLELDRFIPHHYAAEYENNSLTGEHAHEILLRPIGQPRIRPSTSNSTITPVARPVLE